MPRAVVVQILVLAALTSCATISGLADKQAVDCPGDCDGGSLPPRPEDGEDGEAGRTDGPERSDGGATDVAIDAPPKCDPVTNTSCIALPAGWSLVTGAPANDPTPATCASGAQPVIVEESPVPQFAACTCDTCTVTAAASCSGPIEHRYSIGGACGNNGDPDLYSNPVAGTCYQDLPTGPRAATANRFLLQQPSGGACAVTPTKHFDRVSFGGTYVLCDEASRCSGGFCDVQGMPAIATCIGHSGEEQCPAGFGGKHTVGTDGADFDCGACSCNLNRGPCEGTVNHYTDANCTNGLVAIPANSGCGGPNTQGASFASYKLVAPSATTCNTGGSTSAGNARLKNPRTICCRN